MDENQIPSSVISNHKMDAGLFIEDKLLGSPLRADIGCGGVEVLSLASVVVIEDLVHYPKWFLQHPQQK